jgi:peptide/nickel transport system permease protein
MAAPISTPQTTVPAHDSPRQAFWREFRRNRPAYFSLWLVVFLAVVALLADVLAYNKPYYAVYRGQTYTPLVNDYLSAVGLYRWDPELINARWRELPLDAALWPPVTYLPEDQDKANMGSVGPFDDQTLGQSRFQHYLGTDEIGRDLLAGLIHGTRISLSVGVVSVGISAFIGIILGALAGYLGDNRLQVTRATLFAGAVGVFAGVFYGFFVRSYVLADALGENLLWFVLNLLWSVGIFVLCVVGSSGLAWGLKRIPWFRRKLSLWVDITISRSVEVMVSIPLLLLIISVAAIATPSLYLVMVVIGFTSWTRIALLTRAEMLKVRNLDYIQAAQAQGFTEFRIIFGHALPNTLAPVFIAIAFGVASAILVESSLSFLSLGVPPSTVTWGSLLSQARHTPRAWWLAVFPGFAIFLTVTCFNLLGEGLRDALDPRLKK